MPPFPSNIRDETSNLVEALTRCQTDFQQFQIPRLRNYKGTLASQQQYAAELREDLDLFARNVKTLESLGEDHERERDRREIGLQAQNFAQSLEQMKKDTRAALLTSKRAIDSLAQSNRDELLGSVTFPEKTYSDEKSGNDLMNASNDVTEALRRTIGLMQGELERSVLSSQMLEQSSAALRSTTKAHDNLSVLLSTSKHLITALEKSDWLDRLLIFTAVAFFFLVVLFILKQRVLDRSLRVAFWWMRFFPKFHGGTAPLKVGRGGAVATATDVLTSFAARATASQSPAVLNSVIDQTLSTLLQSDTVSSTASPDIIESVSQELLHSTVIPETPLFLTKDPLEGNAETQRQEL